MKKPLNIPADTLQKQAEASDPENSVWVSANAGSGKTHVLAQRVIRLLLGGTDPAKILCLTYTRAAAANMSNRVFRDLAGWIALSDEELGEAIARIEGRLPDARKLRLARRLFGKALETPGGLKIQTIHAFCEAILHQFPLEANIAAHFQLLDAQMEEALFAEARRDMISGAADGGDPVLARAFAAVLDRGGEYGLEQVLNEIVARRVRLREFIDRLRSTEPTDGYTYPALFAEFGFGPDEDAVSIAEAAWPLPGFPPDAFRHLCAAAQAAGGSVLQNNILPDAIAGFAEADPVRRLELLASGFLKKDGGPYGDRTFTKALVAIMPDVFERYAQAAAVLMEARERLAVYRMLQATSAVLVIADLLIGRYERLKTSRGFLDFGDLITRTVRLLSREDAGAWVQYKLDRGIDHILLDEAQDTSPDQWQVVRRLAAEFFAGAGARDEVRRTVFAVGDEKQSIYSFQGADPTSFAESGRAFGRDVAAAERTFRHVPLTLSFRSTQDILDAVDLVFEDIEVRRGFSSYEAHSARRLGEPGYVELWPSLGAAREEEEDDWRLPVNHLTAPAIQLAEHIANTIHGWIGSGALLEGRGRPIAAADVLVLVRKRDRFVHALSRALKNLHIPVAGADRLRLGAHIAVQDLLALGRFLLLSEDDLSLAAVLKSPIFGLSEDDLMRLAADRPPGQSLIERLNDLMPDDARVREIRNALELWRSEAAFKPAFEFYSGVLQRDGVRASMIARLGNEAGDMLDEFLSFCLAYEQPGLPGLEALIATLETGGPEIKREMDQTRGEVRIMTVHASKGLEAPIVFLVDSGSAPIHSQHLPRLMPLQGTGTLKGGEVFVWNSDADVKNSHIQSVSDRLKELADDEYRRLLYVGMTRAEDRLIVCGYHGRLRQNERSWHMLVGKALGMSPNTVASHDERFDGEVLRFRSTAADAVAAGEPDAGPGHIEVLPDLPGFGPTPSPEQMPRPLTPSGAIALVEPALEPAASGRSPVLDPGEDQSRAAIRGRAVHKLLQTLPDIGAADRETAARRYLAHAMPDWPEAERQAVWHSVARTLEDSAFAPIFAPGSRAEVSLMGKLTVRGKERTVSGQTDRLAVTDEQVLIVDYKTNRTAPAGLDAVQPAYLLQLAIYAELLRPLYPDKAIRAALLYTEGPALIEIPEAARQAALARLTGA